MTIATIGRLTKNSTCRQGFFGWSSCWKPALSAGGVQSFTVTVAPSRAFCSPLDNHFVARLKTFGHFPHRADALAHFHRTNADLVVLIDHCDLKIALQFAHRFLRNNHRAFLHVRDEAHFSELSGPQNVSRIWKGHLVANRAGLWIEIAIERIKFSLVADRRCRCRESIRIRVALE